MIGLLWQHRWVSTKQKGPHRAVWTTPSARLLTELPKVAHPPNLVQYYHQEIWRLKWSENLYPLLWKKKENIAQNLLERTLIMRGIERNVDIKTVTFSGLNEKGVTRYVTLSSNSVKTSSKKSSKSCWPCTSSTITENQGTNTDSRLY